MQKIFISILFLFTALMPVNGWSKDKKQRTDPGYQEIQIRMEDGVCLSTDVYIPRTRKPCPVVLVRTPYGKTAEKWMGKAFNLFRIAVVIQDVRGKYKSQGDFYPFRNERSDGLSTLHWIRSQPWSDGHVAGWGASYLGYTQWSISDSLDFMVPLLTGSNLYDFVYPDGIYSLQSAFNWGVANASQGQNKISADKVTSGMRILPLTAADDSTVAEIPFLTDWMNHPTEDNYWKNMSYRGITRAPVLCVAGWYDIFLKAQLLDFKALQKTGSPDNRMVIGPWCHGSQGFTNDYGGIRRTSDPKSLFAYTLKALKGKKKHLKSPLKDTRFNLFIMERNEYAGSETWPPKETRMVPFFLSSDHKLSQEKPATGETLSYVYDPADPYPSHGGTALGDHVGPALQNDNLGRKDQAVFETGVLFKPLILLGEISASLWLESSAPCTEFVVCLEDIFPDGKIINIQEGASQVRFNGSGPEQKEVGVWATGYQLNSGHRLRVVITSSWFPRFNRDLNGCAPFADASQTVKATQKIFVGAATPSRVDLPLYEFQKR